MVELAQNFGFALKAFQLARAGGAAVVQGLVNNQAASFNVNASNVYLINVFKQGTASVVVNGVVRQSYSTKEMIWNFGEVLEYLSQDFTFVPGFGIPSEVDGQFQFVQPAAGQAIFSGRDMAARRSPTISSQDWTRAMDMPARRRSNGSSISVARSPTAKETRYGPFGRSRRASQRPRPAGGSSSAARCGRPRRRPASL